MEARKLTQESIVERLEELPTLPTVVYELSKIMNDPMSSTGDVEKVMSNDLSLTAKVLRLVNSAYFSIPGGVSSLSRAIAYIGFDTVNQLVLSSSILEALERTGPQRFDTNEFWKHSFGVGMASEVIAKTIGHPTPSDMFTSGLVHDLGKVALFVIEPEAMLSIVKKTEAEQISYSEAEERLGIPGHTQIGQALAKKWSLPQGIEAIIRHHHTQEHAKRGPLAKDTHRNIDIVYLANLLIHALKFGHSGHSRVSGAPRDVLERLGLHPDRDLKTLVHEIKQALDKGSDFLRLLGNAAGK